jgi:branched-chain amino acid transport system permease protein
VLLTAFAILTDGLVYAAYLFIVAIGLTLIFGVMKILNVTHGSFYAFGAYGAATAVGIYANADWPAALGFLFMIALAMAIGLVMGLALERGILRLVYGRDEVVVVLVTYAVFLILEDIIVLIWGSQSKGAYQPMVSAGNIEIGSLVLSNYDIILVALAALLAIAAAWTLKFTRYGRLLTTVIFDRETAAAFGINVTLVYTVTFVIGAMLGALAALSIGHVDPNMAYWTTSGGFVFVTILAGAGSVAAAFVGSLAFEALRSLAVDVMPGLWQMTLGSVLLLTILFLPDGLGSLVKRFRRRVEAKP